MESYKVALDENRLFPWINDYIKNKSEAIGLKEHLEKALTELQSQSQQVTSDLQEEMKDIHENLPMVENQVQVIQKEYQWLWKESSHSDEGNTNGRDEMPAQLREEFKVLARLQQIQASMESTVQTVENILALNDGISAIKKSIVERNISQIYDLYRKLEGYLTMINNNSEKESYQKDIQAVEIDIKKLIYRKVEEHRDIHGTRAMSADELKGLYAVATIVPDCLNRFFETYVLFRVTELRTEWEDNVKQKQKKVSILHFLSLYFTDVVNTLTMEMNSFEGVDDMTTFKQKFFVSFLQAVSSIIKEDIILFLSDSFDLHMQSCLTVIEKFTIYGRDVIKIHQTCFPSSKEGSTYDHLLRPIMQPLLVFADQYETVNLTALAKVFLLLIPSIEKQKEQKTEIDDEFLSDGVGENNRHVDEVRHFLRQLNKAYKKITTTIDAAVSNCILWSKGGLLPALVQAVSMALDELFTELTKSDRTIRERLSLPYEDVMHWESIPQDEDWSIFHLGMEMLQTVADMHAHLCTYEKELKGTIRKYVWNQWNENLSLRRSTEDETMYIKERLALLLLEDKTRKENLQTMYRSVSDHTGWENGLLVGNAYYLWKKDAQKLMYDISTLPIKQKLYVAKKSNQWSCNAKVNDMGFSMFHLLPQEAMTSAANRLLNLLPQVQSLSENSNLFPLVVIISSMEDFSVKEWRKVLELVEFSKEEYNNIVADTNIIHCITPVENENQDDGHAQKESQEENYYAMEFVDLCTNVVASGVLAFLVYEICTLRTAIPPNGREQLKTDLSYLQNVLHALGIRPPRLFTKLCAIVSGTKETNEETDDVMEQIIETKLCSTFSFLLPK